jgi:hypothetical protein
MSDSKKTVDKKLEIIEKISALADSLTLEYVTGLASIINDPDADDAQKAKAYREMDKVLRIAKQYSERVLLAEGKNTSNIGIDGKGGLPFKVIFTETFEGVLPEGATAEISREVVSEDQAQDE